MYTKGSDRKFVWREEKFGQTDILRARNKGSGLVTCNPLDGQGRTKRVKDRQTDREKGAK